MDSLEEKELLVPIIPLREMVVFPSTIVPILIGRDKSVLALKRAMKDHEGMLFLVAQKNQISVTPLPEEIYQVGTIAKIEKALEQENGSFRVIIQGLQRGLIVESSYFEDGSFMARVQRVETVQSREGKLFETAQALIAVFEEYIQLKKIRVQGIVAKLKPNQLADITDIIVSLMPLPVKVKQSLLEEFDVYLRGVRVLNVLKREVVKLRAESPLETISKRGEPGENEFDEYRRKIENASLPDYVRKRAEEELERLLAMPPFSAESTVSRYYLDWLLAVPWEKTSRESRDVRRASRILDEDHYGLHKVKNRILDYLAVRQMVKKPTGEILCFVGPPGVGKSSLAKSIARALNRRFVRVSLGGVRDEAEIRGHRRTYIGSYPGQIIKGLKKAATLNPVFLLDEIDKLSCDFRGDPASALLEVLDPEQNSEFIDHYLDLEVNLSKVFFITTANTLEPIPPALRDRMEIIELPGYTEREKLEIAKRFLLPKQAEKNGLKRNGLTINDEVILKIITEYTREAGVRNLEREIAVVVRKSVRSIVEGGRSRNNQVVDEKLMRDYLGIAKHIPFRLNAENEVGVALGLAWTSAGGDVLVIESRLVKGKGDLILTGRLGEIMKESSATAFSHAKVKLAELDLDTDELKNYNIHLHIPEGAVPKEGPSAGVTLAVSLISLLTGIPVKSDFAMTGEITLRGKVLAVGGVKEKIIAAHRFRIKNVLIPADNEKEFIEEIPQEIKNDLLVHPVSHIDEVLELVLERPIKVKTISSKILRPFIEANLQ